MSLADWTNEQCGEWVAKVAGFPEYRATFVANINGNRLHNLTSNQLVSLGVSNHDHQLHIMAALREEIRVREENPFGDQYENEPEYHV